ncbi:glycoside hydrolase family protein [Hyphobacterium sp.]|uniref:glycoside hydrolase family protein n=1 Tax=Hyphobacterium sp. TaxID=2004662 RepID=UPI0037488130
MKPRLKSTPAARELIKAHEPFAANAQQQSDGSWVIGYGHRAAAKAGASVTADEAELLLVYDVLQAEQAIDETLGGDLGDPQRDALVSFALGVGLASFRRSAVVRLIRKERWQDAAEAIAAWNGGGVARHEAERALFLKDIPADTDRAPVELVIEFDHPSDDDAAIPAAVEVDNAPDTEPEAASPEEPDAEPEPEAVEDEPAEPAQPAPVRMMPGRSELAERVILRMRAQLSGPVRESGYAAPQTAEHTPAEPEEAVTEPESAAEPMPGVLGFAFTQSVSIDEDDEAAPEETDAGDLPPIVGVATASTDGVTGEVSGAGEVSDETGSEDEDDDPMVPSDIDAEFAEDGEDSPAMNGWSNGDAAPAPGKNGGHLGEMILLFLGLALLVGGSWELVSQLGSGESEPNLFIGLVALVVGFIFAVGAGIWLLGSRKK